MTTTLPAPPLAPPLDPLMTTEKPKTLSVKLEMDVVESARIVAAFRSETMTEMLSAILRPILARMEQEESAKRYRRTARKGKEGEAS